MEELVKQLAVTIRGFKQPSVNTAVFGVITTKNSIMLELYKNSSKLLKHVHDEGFEELLNNLQADLMIAQVTNAIGSSDLENLMDQIEDIRKEMEK